MAPRNISFDYEEHEDYMKKLYQSSIESRGESIVTHHLDTLVAYGEAIEANDQVIDNTYVLGAGYEDLVVVLLAPSEQETYRTTTEMVYNSYKDNALTIVQSALKFAFGDKRAVRNTIIMDIRPYRLESLRAEESFKTRQRRDQEAEGKFMEALNKLKPKVILLCQCTTGQDHGLKSSTWRSGMHRDWKMPNGHETTIVESFHPSYIMRTEGDSLRKQARRHLFYATFVVAANKLMGRDFYGSGLYKMRRHALKGYGKGTAGSIQNSPRKLGKSDITTPTTPAKVMENTDLENMFAKFLSLSTS